MRVKARGGRGMIRGETITTRITGFPVAIEDIREMYVIFSTSSSIVMEKSLEDCTLDTERQAISFRLTQEESLKLKTGNIQRSVIVVTNDGSRFESHPSEFRVYETKKGEVI